MIVMGVICALVLGGGIYSYTNAVPPGSCSSVSGASVTGDYKDEGKTFVVSFYNYSGSRCSASYKLYGKLVSDGSWEYVTSAITTADNGKSTREEYSTRGYSRMRLDEISTWKCD